MKYKMKKCSSALSTCKIDEAAMCDFQFAFSYAFSYGTASSFINEAVGTVRIYN